MIVLLLIWNETVLFSKILRLLHCFILYVTVWPFIYIVVEITAAIQGEGIFNLYYLSMYSRPYSALRLALKR
jgi:hypothetical protein